MSEEGYDKDENAEMLGQAIELLPTEFRCFDLSTERVELTDQDMRLKELEIKVEHTLHVKAGHKVIMEAGANNEEIQEFAFLIKEKATEYERFAELLKSLFITK